MWQCDYYPQTFPLLADAPLFLCSPATPGENRKRGNCYSWVCFIQISVILVVWTAGSGRAGWPVSRFVWQTVTWLWPFELRHAGQRCHFFRWRRKKKSALFARLFPLSFRFLFLASMLSRAQKKCLEGEGRNFEGNWMTSRPIRLVTAGIKALHTLTIHVQPATVTPHCG